MEITNYKKLKEDWKAAGEIPEWYSTNALQFFMESYSYNGESVLSRDTTTCEYLAKHAPKVKPDWWGKDPYTKGKDWKEVFLNLVFYDGYAVFSTPLKANGGLPERGMPISCSGQTLGNSIASKSFIRGELEQLIKNAHGCAISLEDWLAEGTVYDADGNMSEGIVPLIKDFQQVTEEINQGIRRGQTAFYVNVEHGDFYKVADLLEDMSDKLNIGWIVRDSFVSKLVAKDPEALNRLKKIIKLRASTGKGYITKLDTMKRNRAEVFKILGLEAKGSNLCVAPETEILTRNGYQIISELEGQDVEVWNGEEWSKTVIVKTGESQKLVTVKTSSNQELTCTEYHKWYVQDGYSGGKIIEKRTHELKVGDKLIKFDLPIIEGSLEIENAYTNGFYSGDGCLHKGIQRTFLYHGKQDLLDKMEDVRNIYVDKKQNRTVVTHNGKLKDKFFVPLGDYTIDSKLKWLAGLLDSDGTVARNGTNESLQITSVHLEFLRQIQLMLQTLGVSSKINNCSEAGYRMMPLNNGTGESGEFYCRESWRLLVSSSGLFKLAELGLVTYRLKWVKRLPQRNAEQFVTIKEIVDEGRYDDTYCFTEPKRHMGVFNGILTGQCVELNLPANDEYTFSCPIINANLSLYDEFPEHLFQLIQIMQDCNVSGYLEQIESKKGFAKLFLSKIYKFTKDFRATGMGTCGFHSLLMQRGYPVGSFEAMVLNEEIFKRQRDDTREASQWLGDVLGVPEGIAKAGKTYRNATTMFAPPTKGSVELTRNTPSEGVSLETALVKVKETTGGDIFRINYEFLKFLKKRGLYKPEIIEQVAKDKGSCQNVKEMTDEEKYLFRIAFEVPVEDHLDLCAQRQPFFDQQQSINLAFSGNDDEEYIGAMHMKALLDDNINALYYNYGVRGATHKRIKECAVCQ